MMWVLRGAGHLQVHLRVPVGVKHDNCVGCLQIEAQAAGACGQEEYEVRAPRSVEGSQHGSPGQAEAASLLGMFTTVTSRRTLL